jgi:pimeloyl-ACP methyl ester carboxylesterase
MMAEKMAARDLAGGIENVPGLKTRALSVCGGPISVYEAGDPARPQVMMLHGAMYDESRFIWDQLFPFLSSDFHVFALDIPRHGKSRPWRGFLDRARLMDILDASFSQLGLERFSLVGLSMGGGLSIEYASLHPGNLRSMVLFEPGGLGDKVDMEFLVWLYIKTPGMLGMLSRAYAKKSDEGLRKILESIYVGGSAPTDPDRLIAILKDEVQGKRRNGENDMDDWQLSGVGPFKAKWNLLDRIPSIKCPSLWLRGADSALVKQHEMERAVRLAREGGASAEFVQIPNAGHILPLERPREANAAVKAFLDRTSAG